MLILEYNTKTIVGYCIKSRNNYLNDRLVDAQNIYLSEKWHLAEMAHIG